MQRGTDHSRRLGRHYEMEREYNYVVLLDATLNGVTDVILGKHMSVSDAKKRISKTSYHKSQRKYHIRQICETQGVTYSMRKRKYYIGLFKLPSFFFAGILSYILSYYWDIIRPLFFYLSGRLDHINLVFLLIGLGFYWTVKLARKNKQSCVLGHPQYYPSD